jgi:ketosteroid isomerase-like protein
MSQENVEVVKRAIAAVNDRDVDRYLACCTEDIQMRTPMAPIEGVYEGADAIRRFFANIQDTSPDFRIEVERLDSIAPNRVLAFGHTTATDTPAVNIYDLTDGKIRRIRIFLDRQEALEAAGLSE